jgi:glycine cleavage system H protein
MTAQNFDIPEGVSLCETHEYVLVDDDRARVGISHFAVEQLGDIVFVELPQIGDKLDQGDTFGTIESVKTASDLYMPVSGEIISVNTQLEEEPGLVNENNYGDGWLVEIQISDPTQLEGLMSPEAYVKMLADAAH